MDIFPRIPVPDLGVNIFQTLIQIQISALSISCMHLIYCTVHIGFVTAVNELEFCKKLKRKVNSAKTGMDILTTSEL